MLQLCSGKELSSKKIAGCFEVEIAQERQMSTYFALKLQKHNKELIKCCRYTYKETQMHKS